MRILTKLGVYSFGISHRPEIAIFRKSLIFITNGKKDISIIEHQLAYRPNLGLKSYFVTEVLCRSF